MKTVFTQRHLLLLAAASCGPTTSEAPEGNEAERYSQAVCQAVTSCGCYNHFETETACQVELGRRFSELQQSGLALDLECFEKVVDDGGLADCDLGDEIPDDWACTVLRGAGQAGEMCSDHNLELPPFFVNECAVGLLCLDGMCAAEGTLGPARVEGEACFAEQSASCHAADLYCAEEGTCELSPLEGAACDTPFSCILDYREDEGVLYCRGNFDAAGGVCTRQSLVGAACNPLDWFACYEAGEPSNQRAWCDPSEGLCVAEAPIVCLATDFPKARANTL